LKANRGINDSHLSMCTVRNEGNTKDLMNDLEQPLINECISAQYYDETGSANTKKMRV